MICVYFYTLHIYLYIYTHIYWYHVKVHSFGASRWKQRKEQPAAAGPSPGEPVKERKVPWDFSFKMGPGFKL